MAVSNPQTLDEIYRYIVEVNLAQPNPTDVTLGVLLLAMGTAIENSIGGGSGSVTSVSVVSANGLAGTVATATTTPAITLSTTITGLLKGNATAISAATAGSDYSAGTSALATGIVKSTTSTGALSIASAGTDYLAPAGSGAALTGIPTSVSNADGSLSVTPTTGSVVVSRPAATTVSVTSNAGTVPVTAQRAIFTNSSSATMAITIATTSATSAQPLVVQIYDFAGTPETIGWTNTENSTISVPTTSNGSTTLPLTVGFIFNSSTTKWRCVASA